MEKIDSRAIDLVVDLESGNTTSDEDEIKERRLRHLQNQGMDWDDKDAFQNESVLRGEGLNSTIKNSFISGEGVKMINVGDDDVRVEAGRDSMEKKMLGEKMKQKGSKKPPKPPRPPGGPSLNEADIKFVKQISELSRLRRARYERIKALKKMRADKTSSSKSNVPAMIVTILFISIIIFQDLWQAGIGSKKVQGFYFFPKTSEDLLGIGENGCYDLSTICKYIVKHGFRMKGTGSEYVIQFLQIIESGADRHGFFRLITFNVEETFAAADTELQ
ncbi:hypothetical protein REPUB_Repub16aG0149600 [Reevesia pubescens]